MENMQNNSQQLNSSSDRCAVPFTNQDKPKTFNVPHEKANLTSYSFVRNNQKDEIKNSSHSPSQTNDNKVQNVPQQYMNNMGFYNIFGDKQQNDANFMTPDMSMQHQFSQMPPQMIQGYSEQSNDFAAQMQMASFKQNMVRFIIY